MGGIDLNDAGVQEADEKHLHAAFIEASRATCQGDAARIYAKHGISLYPMYTAGGRKVPHDDIKLFKEAGFGKDIVFDENGNPKIDEKTRRPMRVEGTGGIKKATTVAWKVAKAWEIHPDALPALKTPRWCFVVDQDVHHEDQDGIKSLEALEQKYSEKINTLTTETPSGGRHLYFKLKDEQKKKIYQKQQGIFPGIDIFPSGYTIIEGITYKLINDAPVAELPDWLFNEFLSEINKKNPQQQTKQSQTSYQPPVVNTVEGINIGYRLVQTPVAWTEKRISDALNELAEVVPGSRHKTIHDQSAIFGQMVWMGSITRDWAYNRIHTAIEARESEIIDNSTGNTRYTWADAEKDINDGLNWGMANPPRFTGNEPEDKSNSFEFLEHLEDYSFGSGIYQGYPPEYDWCVEGLIERGNIGCLTGPGALGKSTMGCQLVTAAGIGSSWLGAWNTGDPGLTLYMSSEDNTRELHRRAYAISTTLTNEQMKDFRHFVKFTELKGRAALLRQDSKSLQVVEQDSWKYFCDKVCKLEPKLIVIDPISAVTLVNENDNTAMTEALIYIEELAREANTTIIFLHHTTKDKVMIQQKNEIKKSLVHSAIRGAGAIVNRPRLAMLGYPLALDVADLLLEDGGEPFKFDGEVICFKDVKKNCGPLGPVRYFRHSDRKGLLVPMLDVKEEAEYLEDRDQIRIQKQEQELDDLAERASKMIVSREQNRGDVRIAPSGICRALNLGRQEKKSDSIANRAQDLGLAHIVTRVQMRSLGFGDKISGNGGGCIVIPSFDALTRFGKSDGNGGFVNIAPNLLEFIKDIGRGRYEDKLMRNASPFDDEE